MSAQNPASETELLTNLPIPWLVGGPNGHAEWTALGNFLDAQIALVKLATKAHFPDYAPTDALPHIGGDRQLEQGPTETNASFITRLKNVWGSWSHGGTAVELLAQLYYDGFPSAVIVQQNGLMYSLSAAPTPGVDPTSLLNITLADPNLSITQTPNFQFTVVCTTAGSLGTAQFTLQVNGFATVTGATPAASTTGTLYPFPSIYTWVKFPNATYATTDVFVVTASGSILVASGGFAGATYNSAPWWTFDGNSAHTSRFAVLFPSGGGAFTTSGTAVFTGVEDGSTAHPWPTVTWNNSFADTSYTIQVGIPSITDSAGPVVVAADNTTKTKTGVQVDSSASFTGTVDVLAWPAGANPYANINAANLALLRRLINRWRPAKALCMGVWAIANLPVWGYPSTTSWGQSGLRWGQSSVAQFGV